MQGVGIHTTQNVVLLTEPASIGERMVAAILDYITLGVYSFIISFIIGLLEIESFAIILLLISPIIFYSLVLESTQQGQTLGKAIMKIKVVNVNGSHPSFGSYFLRWIFRIVDVLMLFGGIGTLTIILNGKGQRLGDIAAKTMVVRIKSKTTIDDTILVEVSEQYTPVFKEAIRLSEKDVQIIKDVINYAISNPKTITTSSLVNKTRIKIINKLGVQAQPDGLQFLEIILADYNWMSTQHIQS